jgi:hypothetical protein
METDNLGIANPCLDHERLPLQGQVMGHESLQVTKEPLRISWCKFSGTGDLNISSRRQTIGILCLAPVRTQHTDRGEFWTRFASGSVWMKIQGCFWSSIGKPWYAIISQSEFAWWHLPPPPPWFKSIHLFVEGDQWVCQILYANEGSDLGHRCSAEKLWKHHLVRSEKANNSILDPCYERYDYETSPLPFCRLRHITQFNILSPEGPVASLTGNFN